MRVSQIKLIDAFLHAAYQILERNESFSLEMKIEFENFIQLLTLRT